jgi:hypothetical protein
MKEQPLLVRISAAIAFLTCLSGCELGGPVEPRVRRGSETQSGGSGNTTYIRNVTSHETERVATYVISKCGEVVFSPAWWEQGAFDITLEGSYTDSHFTTDSLYAWIGRNYPSAFGGSVQVHSGENNAIVVKEYLNTIEGIEDAVYAPGTGPPVYGTILFRFQFVRLEAREVVCHDQGGG